MNINPIGPLFDGNDKEGIAIERICTFAPPEGLCVMNSGGKDSVLTVDLVKRSGVKFDAHYNLTTCDPPELVHFLRKHHPETQIHRPEMTMWDLIVKKKLPPTRMIRYCCDVLKEGRGYDDGRIVATGIRWAESSRRGKRRMVEQCNRRPGKHYLHPIIDWTDADVWEYIRRHNLPYCSLYDEGFTRLGCVMCPMASKDTVAREMKRWPKLAAAYKRAIEKSYRVNDLSSKGWKSADDMWEWWLNGGAKEEEDTHPWLFE